jgi:IclR family transcriptional regulator, mhp operon transcriptional activator
MTERSSRAERRSYANVLVIERVLAVLQAVNKLPSITVKAISDECGIPASSVVRILETLCAKGFLLHVSRRGGYALTSRMCTLSAGYHGTPLVVELLRAHVDELTRFHLWPFSVATLDRDAMVVQYSSIPLSPFAHVRTTYHKRLSLLSRAHGLAYLSFCHRMERRHLVRMAVAAHNPDDRVITSGQCWRDLVRNTRRRGYALRATDVDSFTQTIAVPIVLEPGRVIATLGMTFFRSIVHETQYADYAAMLKVAAASAVERIRRHPVADPAAEEGVPPAALPACTSPAFPGDWLAARRERGALHDVRGTGAAGVPLT